MIDSLRRVLEYAIGYLDIVPDSASTDADIAAIAQMIAAYDALAPKPDAWPDGAQWFAIDANGWRWFCMFEPEINSTEWFLGRYGSYSSSGEMPIGIGVDWRLCKWQRPEVTP